MVLTTSQSTDLEQLTPLSNKAGVNPQPLTTSWLMAKLGCVGPGVRTPAFLLWSTWFPEGNLEQSRSHEIWPCPFLPHGSLGIDHCPGPHVTQLQAAWSHGRKFTIHPWLDSCETGKCAFCFTCPDTEVLPGKPRGCYLEVQARGLPSTTKVSNSTQALQCWGSPQVLQTSGHAEHLPVLWAEVACAAATSADKQAGVGT